MSTEPQVDSSSKSFGNSPANKSVISEREVEEVDKGLTSDTKGTSFLLLCSYICPHVLFLLFNLGLGIRGSVLSKGFLD